ncbi:unnamed protein product, partial [Closterium sp. NIES-53]
QREGERKAVRVQSKRMCVIYPSLPSFLPLPPLSLLSFLSSLMLPPPFLFSSLAFPLLSSSPLYPLLSLSLVFMLPRPLSTRSSPCPLSLCSLLVPCLPAPILFPSGRAVQEPADSGDAAIRARAAGRLGCARGVLLPLPLPSFPPLFSNLIDGSSSRPSSPLLPLRVPLPLPADLPLFPSSPAGGMSKSQQILEMRRYVRLLRPLERRYMSVLLADSGVLEVFLLPHASSSLPLLVPCLSAPLLVPSLPTPRPLSLCSLLVPCLPAPILFPSERAVQEPADSGDAAIRVRAAGRLGCARGVLLPLPLPSFPPLVSNLIDGSSSRPSSPLLPLRVPLPLPADLPLLSSSPAGGMSKSQQILEMRRYVRLLRPLERRYMSVLLADSGVLEVFLLPPGGLSKSQQILEMRRYVRVLLADSGVLEVVKG